MDLVAFDITPNLRNPIRSVVAARELLNATGKVASVPKISVAEDRNAGLAKNDVRTSREISAM